jgi:hypothetical protein
VIDQRIPYCLLISDVIIHPIYPSIIVHPRIHGPFLIIHHFHFISLCPIISHPPILFCTHPLTQPHSRLSVLSKSKSRVPNFN